MHRTISQIYHTLFVFVEGAFVSQRMLWWDSWINDLWWFSDSKNAESGKFIVADTFSYMLHLAVILIGYETCLAFQVVVQCNEGKKILETNLI